MSREQIYASVLQWIHGKKSEVPEPDRPDPRTARSLGNDEPTAGAHDRGPERTSRATGRQECSQLSTVISPSRGSQQKLNLNMHMQKETENWYGGTWKSVLCMWHLEVQIATAQAETATAYARDERYGERHLARLRGEGNHERQM